MSSGEVQSVLYFVRHRIGAYAPGGQALVPIPDMATFSILADEASRLAIECKGEGISLILDARTAQHLANVDGLRAVADKLYVFGSLPPGWTPPPDLSVCEHEEAHCGRDRFLIALSPTHSVAVMAEADLAKGFHGGWSAQPDHVREIAAGLFECIGRPLPAFAPAGPGAHEGGLAWAHELMGRFSERLPDEKDIVAVDKHDLLSVLEILKAISSKRRSHDVLYVFVEKIAQVIDTCRCSVVRVWGDDRSGHVLASHDDERVSNLQIDLDKYPELGQALDTLGKVIVDDVADDPLTKSCTEELRCADISALMVIPIVLLDPNVGSLFLRAARKARPFTQREVSFCEIVAEAASNALERAHLFESIQKANERLEVLAVTDGLTGLFNHRHFRERLEEEFDRARRYDLPLACLIYDIDDFKKINDTHGHLEGDRILQEMAARTLKIIRRSDLAARYGGEEFTIIMPQTGYEGAKAQADRLLEEVRAHPYLGVPGGLTVTVSMGVAILDHERMLTCEDLIREADGALYEAKGNGKDQVVVANPPGDDS